MYYSNNDEGSIFGAIVTIILFIGLVVGIKGCNAKKRTENAATWNNGVCEKCHEGKLKFKNATSAYAEMDKYYYECDECGHVQFFYSIME